MLGRFQASSHFPKRLGDVTLSAPPGTPSSEWGFVVSRVFLWGGREGEMR